MANNVNNVEVARANDGRILTAAERKYQKQAAKEAARYAARKQEAARIAKKVEELRKTNPAAAAKLAEKANKKMSKINETAGDHIFNVITSIFLILIALIVGYPCLYVLSASFSDAAALQAGEVLLWPVDFSLDGYKFVLDYKQVWIGYRNSIFYTVMGVLFTGGSSILAAYPLSKRNFQFRNKYMLYFYLTTLFGAGLIPSYLNMKNLGLIGTIWPVLLQGTVAVNQIIILRTAFQSSIPGELFDAAKIDGANDYQALFKIALPLAKASLSVIMLYTIVGAWNEYFTSMIYLHDPNLQPLQLVLRPIMTAAAGSSLGAEGMSSASQEMAQKGLDQVRYVMIIIATVPPLVAYFLIQQSFKSGVMVGSVKG